MLGFIPYLFNIANIWSIYFEVIGVAFLKRVFMQCGRFENDFVFKILIHV